MNVVNITMSIITLVHSIQKGVLTFEVFLSHDGKYKWGRRDEGSCIMNNSQVSSFLSSLAPSSSFFWS